MLVDGGTGNYKNRVAKYLTDNDLTHMDIVFNSHPHDDHLQAVRIMLKTEELIPAQFMSPFPEDYGNDLQLKPYSG